MEGGFRVRTQFLSIRQVGVLASDAVLSLHICPGAAPAGHIWLSGIASRSRSAVTRAGTT